MFTLSTFLMKFFILAAEAAPTGQPPGAPSGQPGGGQPGGEASLGPLLITLLPMVVIFWLLIWRPESKRRKQQEGLLNSLKPKDKVVTVGGLYGTVVELDKDDVVLLVDPKKDIKLKFRRSSIGSIESSPAQETGKK